MTVCWRGRGEPDQPQLANGGTRDLTPASDAPALQSAANWAATLPSTEDVPLIWEKENNRDEERDDLQHY